MLNVNFLVSDCGDDSFSHRSSISASVAASVDSIERNTLIVGGLR